MNDVSVSEEIREIIETSLLSLLLLENIVNDIVDFSLLLSKQF